MMSAPPATASPGNAMNDIWGGLAAMLVALPSSIAFGIAIYLALGREFLAQGVMAGILGAAVLGLVAPALGGAPRLITAPCAPAAAVLGTLALHLTHEAGYPPAQAAAMLGLVGLIAGVLQIFFGSIGAGKVIKYIPYPVVSGYLTGVGIYIFLGQLPKFLGATGKSPFAVLLHPASWNGAAVAVGALTIVGMVGAKKITQKIPGAIIGLTAGLTAYGLLALAMPELRTFAKSNPLIIGPLFTEGGLEAGFWGERLRLWAAMPLARLQEAIMPALTLAVLLSIDTLKTCVVMDTLTRSRHNSNRELLGQGTANLLSSLAGGLPGAGTMGATLVNLNSGGRTRLSGVYAGAFVIAAAVLLGNALGWIPLAALAGILMVVACRMMDWHSFHLLRQRATVLDFAVIATVAIIAQFSLIAATGAGLALAILLFLREQMRGSVIRRKIHGHQISSKQYRLPAEKECLLQYGHLTTVCELQGSLFFGNTEKLYNELEPDLKMSRRVILDFRRVQSVDFTAAHMLEQMALTLRDRGGQLAFSGVPEHLPTGQNLRTYLEQVEVVGPQHPVPIFDTLDEALAWAEDGILAEQRLLAAGNDPPLELPEIELLREFEADHTLGALGQCVEQRTCAAGEVIFRQGEPGDELFLIRQGQVRISLPLEGGQHHLIATFGRGNFFGEVAFLDRGLRSADAVAATPTQLYVISRRRFDELSRANPILGVKLFARLARGLAIRLRYTDAELRALKET
ncbi:SulP family inorganic anion transporter [Fontisphaera persica]|uniref:SLC26A/SulP transporter family protein n=1 Tax=Fontisphaera persica TaxID=2974023 RepID=UPI0024C022D4|nr:SulP family inorganic anion transporter [Fontisphaera persica]WCJ58564.1 SulP family inorganic anion transporter [Fontisphaera persica]